MNALFPPEHPLDYSPDSFKFLEAIIEHTSGKLLDNYIDVMCVDNTDEPKQPV